MACSGLLNSVATGMTEPQKVASALDVGGDLFDPSLYYVMAGALLGATPPYWAVYNGKLCRKSISGTSFPLPRSAVDSKLVFGATSFGFGWGLSGLCPGPAVVNLLQGRPQFIVFFVSMMIMFAIVPSF